MSEETKKESPPEDAAKATPDPATIGAGKKVLVVDDDPSSLELVKGLLEKVSYTVTLSNNGPEGLTLAGKEKPDLIIADVVMPKMDGFQFFKELKSNKECAVIPVLILTIRKNMEDSFMVSGADAFVVKPLEAESFVAKVNELIKLPKKKPPEDEASAEPAAEEPAEEPPPAEEKKEEDKK